MITCKELRLRAWNSLKDRYWNALVAMLIVAAISSISAAVSGVSEFLSALSSQLAGRSIVLTAIIAIASLAVFSLMLGFSFFVLYPLNIGSSRYFIRNTYEKPDITDVFFGFQKNYLGNVKTMAIVFLKTFLWTLLFIIPGIIKSFEYSIIPYILAEEPEISSEEAFSRAKALMTGHKWHLFVFSLSYIGWALLGAIVCCGVGSLFVMPYINAGLAEFYKEISKPHFEEQQAV